MSIQKAITNAWGTMKVRQWDTTYFAIDIHGTVLKNNYEGLATEMYPEAEEALRYIATRNDIKIILYTSSHTTDCMKYIAMFEALGVQVYAVNCNPECPSTATGDFSRKFYFSVLLDDKAGFDPATDWYVVIETLKMLS